MKEVIKLGIKNCKKIAIVAVILLIISASITFVQVNAEQDHLINLNTATIEELQQLPHIGEVRAGYIVEYRSTQRIEEIQQLKEISSIGEGVVSVVEDKVKLE